MVLFLKIAEINDAKEKYQGSKTLENIGKIDIWNKKEKNVKISKIVLVFYFFGGSI